MRNPFHPLLLHKTVSKETYYGAWVELQILLDSMCYLVENEYLSGGQSYYLSIVFLKVYKSIIC